MVEVEAGGGTEGDEAEGPPRRRQNKQKDCQELSESRSETETEEDEGNDEEGDRNGEIPRGEPVDVVRLRGDVHPSEENVDLPDFTSERAHLVLQGVYGDLPHHNNGLHLVGGGADNTIWKRRWRQLAAQLSSRYATPSGTVVHRITEILAAEW